MILYFLCKHVPTKFLDWVLFPFRTCLSLLLKPLLFDNSFRSLTRKSYPGEKCGSFTSTATGKRHFCQQKKEAGEFQTADGVSTLVDNHANEKSWIVFLDSIHHLFRVNPPGMAFNRESSAVEEHKAMYGSGFVGWLYDDRYQCVLEQCPGFPRKYSILPCGQEKCLLIKGDSDEAHNLLRTIGIHAQLRLTLWLGFTNPSGIAAVINDKDPIDARTRLLYYSWIEREEHYPEEDLRLMRIERTSSAATHVITGVRFGIEAIAIVQLPSDERIVAKVDDLLERLRNALSSDTDVFSTFTTEEMNLLDRMIKMKVYSNIPSLASLIYASHLAGQTARIKRDGPFRHHIAYFLLPLDFLYYRSTKPSTNYNALPATIHDQLEEAVLGRHSIIRRIQAYRRKYCSGVFTRVSLKKSYTIFEQSSNAEKEIDEEIRQLADLVKRFRYGQVGIGAIEKWITDQDQRSRVINPVELLRAINKLESEVDKKHVSKQRSVENPPDLGIQVNGATEQRISKNELIGSSLPVDDDEVINILLLGETGVGKSTFINAFANYLAFSSLQQARDSEPVVLIPVSFTLTSGQHFEEHNITFGECDPSSNEQFNKRGQSVTQQCRSYVFDLPHHQRRRVCIIDTPGFGDTRGIEQDDRNIEHIREYITQWKYLHAVCFLLKPNESRLNIFFRSCFDQLFSLLGPGVGANVMFCFTNARSTFYAPGNTAPLLKKMLSTVESGSVELKKENAFCFDNESFRYLMAIQNGVEFSKEEEGDYEKSWITSVKESNRLIDHLQRKQPFVLSSIAND